MGVYLAVADLPAWANATGSDAEAAIDAVEALARSVAPSLFPFSPVGVDVDEVKRILLYPAAQMAATRGGLVAKQSSGPFAVEFRDGVGFALSAVTVAALQALVGVVAPEGLPAWSFPAAGDYSGLFANPRRLL